jgi:hypothetical protein
MLKPSDPALRPIGPDEERPVGELVHQLVEDGKAYAKAEVNLVKTIASAKAGALAIPAALVAVGLLFVLAGFGVLATGVFFALESAVGPLLAGLLTFVIFAAIGGVLAKLGINKAKADL